MRPAIFRTLMAVSLAAPLAASAQQADVVFSHQFESGAVSLSPDLVYARAGSTTTGIAGPLLLQLDEPVAANTFVPIVSLNPARLSIDGGGVMVAQGQDSAIVTMTGIASDPVPVLVRASLGNQVYAAVRVFDDGDTRQVVSLRPNPISIAPGGQRSLIATLNLPAASTGTAVDLSVAPLGAGSFTTPITVAANSFSQSFVYTDSNISEIATLSASVAMTPPAQAGIVQSPIGKLVINEVDYDQASTDTDSYIEILNTGASPVSLSGLEVRMINGSNSLEYGAYPLSAAGVSLAPGQYLVIANSTVAVAPGALVITASGDFIQNGGPDGIALFDTNSNQMIDALSYEGSITAAVLTGIPGTWNLVFGTPFAGADINGAATSLARLPNGVDTGDDSVDWALTVNLTPGAANL